MQAFAGMMLFVGTAGLISAYFVRIDEVVSASGILQASNGRVDIKTPIGGKVANVNVGNGDNVKSGDLLLTFDTQLAKEQKETSLRLIELEKAGLERKLNSISLQLKTLEAQIDTKKLMTQGYKTLSTKGGISKLQYLQSNDDLLALINQYNSILERQEETKINAQKQIRQLESSISNSEQQLRYKSIVADRDGIVFDLKAQPGSVIQSGEIILSVVPYGSLKAKVYVPNKDIGFIKKGQAATVRVDAFPSSRYGELDGQISVIGADSLPPNSIYNYYRFPVDIELTKSWLETKEYKIPLRVGMSITSNLKIREKRVITLVSDFFGGQLDSVKALRGG